MTDIRLWAGLFGGILVCVMFYFVVRIVFSILAEMSGERKVDDDEDHERMGW